MISASDTADTLSVEVRIPNSLNRSRLVAWRAVTVMFSAGRALLVASPIAMDPPMLPAPMIVIFMTLQTKLPQS